MPILTCSNTSLYYELHGSGPPLLLIAGLASDSQSWLPVLSGLSDQYTVILLDNRGVGRSDQDCEISISLMADDCIALIRHLGFAKVNLLGHSMGGMVAMECASRYPQYVDKLLLVATVARNSARNNMMFSGWADGLEAGLDPVAWYLGIFTWILTEQFFEQQERVDEAINFMLQYPWPQSAQALRRQVQSIAAFDATAWLQGLSVPTSVVAGQFDILMPVRDLEHLAGLIPGAELKVINGAAHSVQTEQPEAFVECISGFLRQEYT